MRYVVLEVVVEVVVGRVEVPFEGFVLAIDVDEIDDALSSPPSSLMTVAEPPPSRAREVLGDNSIIVVKCLGIMRLS